MSEMKRIAVIGAGTMGAGIAISASVSGFNVIVIDMTEAALESALSRIRRYLDRQTEKQKMSGTEAAATLDRCRFSTKMDSAADSDLVIEAVFEDLAVKRSVFGKLESSVGLETQLATNTSALKVSDIGAGLIRPERLCGLHYFSPAEVNPVVEVVRTDATADATIDAVLSFLGACGKQSIECLDRSGFALNRFFCPYTNEAARCYDDGLGTPAQIDEVARDVFGVAIGPFAVMNIVKPRINLAAVRNLTPLGSFYAPARSLETTGDADDDWDLTGDARIDVTTRTRIGDRLKGAIFLSVLEELTEQVAAPKDIDMGARRAFTFAKGPVEMMREEGAAKVKRLVCLVQPDWVGSVSV
ncbi:3-hydroxyacyl-CoA dehydrogenase family protein [Pelagibius sp. Alg239-R121]|uniref:3-hydroxyacyl-CoA dehydrogenase family protein n=1 Tax=Pelagibius sp. Alg239-R121 TaxID=2993448 RepID=UPI0024A70B2A|nr:3-hydroxyacyl-CoA dehydrogenase family protein [Pelagibius sp. Alg239-R121]